MSSKNPVKFSIFKSQVVTQKHINKTQKSSPSSLLPRSQKNSQKATVIFNSSKNHLQKQNSKENKPYSKNIATSKEKRPTQCKNQSKQKITNNNIIQSSNKNTIQQKFNSNIIFRKVQKPTTSNTWNLGPKYINNIMKKVPLKSINSSTTPCTAKHSRKPSTDKSDKKQQNIIIGIVANKKLLTNYSKNYNSHCSVYHSQFRSSNLSKQKSSSVNSKLKQSQSTSTSKAKNINIPKTNDLRCLMNKYSMAPHLNSQSNTKQKNNGNNYHQKIVNRNIKAKNLYYKEYNKLSSSYIHQGQCISTLNQRKISSTNQTDLFNKSINKNFNLKIQSAKTAKQTFNPLFPSALPWFKKNSDLINEVKITHVAKTTSNVTKPNSKKEICKLNYHNDFNNKIDFLFSKFPYYNSKTVNNTISNLKKKENNTITISNSNSKTHGKFRNLSSSNQRIKESKSENKNLSKNDINEDNDSNISINSLSTSRESNYYKNESKKLSDYIKGFNENKNIFDYPKTTLKFYCVGRRIGNGAFGKVNIGLHILSGHIVAIKSFNKKKNLFSRSKILYEIKLMKKLRGHKSVVQIFEEVETEQHHCIIMENISGGNLLSLISKRIKLPEQTAKYIFKQLIEALKYIHSQGIAHRDIKPDNILIDLNNTIKLCDFGVGKEVKQGQLITDTCGTPAFVAPEILGDSPYDPFQTDIWSSGVVLYSMLTGTFPFRGNNDTELHRNIINGKYPKLTGFSNNCLDLIDKIFQVDPNKRIKLDEIIVHSWLKSSNRVNTNFDLPNLFTNAEKIIYSKLSIDYRFAKKEDLVENFTYKNMDSDLENENQNAKTKSIINSPLNTMRKEYAEDDELYFQDLQIEDTIMRFLPKVIEMNRNYERDFNDETDLGVVKFTKKRGRPLMSSLNNSLNDEKQIHVSLNNNSNNNSNDGGKDNINKAQNNNNNNNNLDSANNMNSAIKTKDIVNTKLNGVFIDDNAVSYVEEFGYNRDYIIKSIEKNELNHATATYYLKLSLQN